MGLSAIVSAHRLCRKWAVARARLAIVLSNIVLSNIACPVLPCFSLPPRMPDIG